MPNEKEGKRNALCPHLDATSRCLDSHIVSAGGARTTTNSRGSSDIVAECTARPAGGMAVACEGSFGASGRSRLVKNNTPLRGLSSVG